MNAQKLLQSLEYASLAYTNVQADLTGKGPLPSTTGITGVQYYLRIAGDLMMVAFRGSDSWKDWLTDLTFGKGKFPMTITPRTSACTPVLSTLTKTTLCAAASTAISPRTSAASGSRASYGAALAVLCAVDLQYNFPTGITRLRCSAVPAWATGPLPNPTTGACSKRCAWKTATTSSPACRRRFRLPARRHSDPHRAAAAARVISFEQHRPQRYYQSLWKKHNASDS